MINKFKWFLPFLLVFFFIVGCEKDTVTPIESDSKGKESEIAEVVEKDVEDSNEKVTEDLPVVSDQQEKKGEEEATKIEDKQEDIASSEEQATNLTEKASEQKKETTQPTTSTEGKSTTSQSSSTIKEKTSSQTNQTVKEQKVTENTVSEKETTVVEEKQAPTPTPPPKKEEPKKTVTISIVGDEKKGTILSKTTVEMNEGETILDITRKILKSKGKAISVTGSGSTAYVRGIDGLFEFDRGPLSGWTVKNNGSTIQRSAGAIELKAGDQVQWIYTTDYEEDGA
ncbi:DUF4430 domain-containing protein [Metabacillus sp. HB246100]